MKTYTKKTLGLFHLTRPIFILDSCGYSVQDENCNDW